MTRTKLDADPPWWAYLPKEEWRKQARALEAERDALREALDGVASPLAIDGPNHKSAVYHARALLGEKDGGK